MCVLSANSKQTGICLLTIPICVTIYLQIETKFNPYSCKQQHIATNTDNTVALYLRDNNNKRFDSFSIVLLDFKWKS